MKSSMVLFSNYRFEWLLGFHLTLGILSAYVPRVLVPWFFFALLGYGLFNSLRTANRYGHAHLTAVYVGSMEILLRMSKVGFPHETGKYSVILLLGTGILFRNSRQPWSWGSILFFILLLPSIFMLNQALDLERFRQNISFNLSGPLCLAVATFYFYKVRLFKGGLRAIFQHALLPLASILGYLMIATPSVKDISFSTGANFAASGYGPNQMSSVLGLGIMLVVLGFLLQLRVWRSNLVISAFLLLLTYRGLLTFSRGGMVGPILALTVSVGYYLFAAGFFNRRSLVRISRFVGLGFLILLSFLFVNEQTGNKLWERYSGKRGNTRISLDKYSSGRTKIVRIDWQIFEDNPVFGIGPGAGNELRVAYGYAEKAAAHIEFTRLLAEHGLLGLLSLSILLFYPLRAFFDRRRTLDARFLLISCTLFTFSFMLHSATRIALPMFLYGLGFVYLVPDRLQKTASAEAKPGTGKHRLASV